MQVNGSGYTILHHFTGTQARMPNGKLLLASDGRLYGVCKQGGANIYRGGALYRIGTDGSGFAIIKQFDQSNGDFSPVGNLVEDAAGVLYGITESAGQFFPPAIYKINKDGSGYSILKKLSDWTEGYDPADGLLLHNGFLYGTCKTGGQFFNGTLFRIRTDGTGFQVLQSMNFNTVGATPTAGLMLTAGGRIFGVNESGGTGFGGTIFSLLPDGTDFTVHKHLGWPNDGGGAQYRLLQASDGKLYGTSQYAGTFGAGTLFSLQPDGTGFSMLYHFNGTQGRLGMAELVEVPLVTLPVQLTRFGAELQGSTVQLRWTTTDEVDTKAFLVERSNGGSFQPLQMVPASGRSRYTSDYKSEDLQPLAGRNDYRLKILDADGSFSYSPTRSVQVIGKARPVIYPNPVTDQLLIAHPWQGGKLSVRFLDSGGKVVLQQIVAAGPVVRVKLQSLPAGTYWLQVRNESEIYTQQLVKPKATQ